jgi:hypothetical protein
VSAWRRIAHERFPQFKTEIDKAESPADLWVELKREFDRAYSYDETKAIKAIHNYAVWMIEETRSDELAQATVDGLYRPLIEQNWSSEDFEQRRPALELPKYLGEEKLTSLYWKHLHSVVPAGKHREFIAELGIGKPQRVR